MTISKLKRALDAAERRVKALETEKAADKEALRKAVAWIDMLKAGTKDGWTIADLKEIEGLRFLSL